MELQFHSFIFAFNYIDFGVKFKKSCLRPMYLNIVPIFSTMCFIVSSLIFKSLIHFVLIFVYGAKEEFTLTLLYVVFQFSEYH